MVDAASIAASSDADLRADRSRHRHASATFATVAAHHSMAAAADPWAHLQAIALISPYQRWDWIDAWMATEGHAAGLTPFIVVASDESGLPVALLPLGLQGAGRVRRAVFLGGRETNYNLGLFDPRLNWTAADAEHLLRRAARTVAGGVDVYALVHQPAGWGPFRNPLARLRPRQPSPSSSHRAILQADGEAFLKTNLSAAARKKLRAKAGHLAALGPVRHRVARTPAEIHAVLSAHLAQKAAKLALLGIAVPDLGALRSLFERACLPQEGRAAPIELHALHCGDAIVATFGGIAHARRFSGLLISYALEPAFARSSPGELLLAAVIRQKCAEGFEGFDLGIGESRYKDGFCPIVDPLLDCFLPLTLTGHVVTLADAAVLRLKGAVKHSPRAWTAMQAIRRRLGRVRNRRSSAPER